eukprot:13868103-Alexandrium_andersonii.AAC.1
MAARSRSRVGVLVRGAHQVAPERDRDSGPERRCHVQGVPQRAEADGPCDPERLALDAIAPSSGKQLSATR